MKKVILTPNPYRDKGFHTARTAMKILQRAGLEVQLCLPFEVDRSYDLPKDLRFSKLERELPNTECVICFGGDGTILHMAKAATRNDIPILGVNIGTMGFMAELESSELEQLARLADNDFVIDRNDNGSILSKKIAFKNYIGSDNYAGFRYGVNLQSISRKIESKNIVTKMIVKNNSNANAKNGYCSITRAGANETGENCLYNFAYYINKGIINSESLSKILYNTSGAKGEDWDADEYTNITNCNGYYFRLRLLNAAIDRETEKNTNYFLPLN